MKSKLITALRQAATALENGTFNYDWMQAQSCNCGVVASCITGLSSDDIGKKIPNTLSGESCDGRSWRWFVGKYCPVTGMPENAVLAALIGAGLTPVDMVHLEKMDDPEVLKRTGIQTWGKGVRKPKLIARLFGAKPVEYTKWLHHYADKKNALAYMRAWADLLVEQGREDVPEHATENAVEEATAQ